MYCSYTRYLILGVSRHGRHTTRAFALFYLHRVFCMDAISRFIRSTRPLQQQCSTFNVEDCNIR